MYFKCQKFLVTGISKSGESAAKFLLERGACVYVYDDMMADKVKQNIDKLVDLGAICVTAESYMSAVEECDILVLSPGIPIDNPLPVTFRKSGKAIIGEEELAALYLRATAIAVTGTNGKTTTVSMIDKMLKDCNKSSVMCGNCGNPLINEVERLSFDDFAVIEISSFQLETMSSLRPHIAIITNLTEDHLNRHYNMENYAFLKSKLIRPLRQSEYAVLNYDDENVRGMADVTKGKVIYFSLNQKVDGAYIEDGWFTFKGRRYFKTSQMQTAGNHNLYNALAAIAVAGILQLDVEASSASLAAFKGVAHRIQTLCEINGVTYIDDSKGTNVDATMKAVDSMNAPTIILLGGKDKGYDYFSLFSFLNSSKVVHAILYGENRFKMLNCAVRAGFLTFSLCADFATAVKLSNYIAKAGSNVLLSPASASFDEFSGYEERGDAFAQMVKEFADE